MSCFSCLSVTTYAAYDTGYTPDTEDAENPEDKIKAWEVIDEGADKFTLRIYCDSGDKPGWVRHADKITSVIFTGEKTDVCQATAIPNFAFYGFENLETVDMTDAVTSLVLIGAHAFDGCINLKEVVIPNSVVTIDDYAFYGCSALETVKLSAALETVGKNVFKGCTGLVNLTIPNGVKAIGVGMFENCTSLAVAQLPDSIEKIGEHAFEGCTLLEKAIVPDSVTDVGGYAFYETGITSAYMGHGVKNIGEYIFGRCTNLKSVEFASDMDTISEWMFYGCTSLDEIVDFPESIKTIGAHSFEGCTALKNVVIPNTVTEIGEAAFYGATVLSDVTLSSALKIIGANAFNGTAIAEIAIPYAVEAIGEGAFANCAALAAINVDSANTAYTSIDGILYNADVTELLFCPVAKAGAVKIPETVTKIGSNAFLNCSAVTEILIPATVDEISVNAFIGCSPELKIKSVCNAYAIQYAKLHNIKWSVSEHAAEGEVVEVTPPTCTVDGTTIERCPVCFADIENSEGTIPATGHTEGEGVVTKAPTCTDTGVKEFTCSVCSNVRTEDIPSLGGHKYDPIGVVLVEPTCDAEGTRRRACQNEGCVEFIDEKIPATGHNYDYDNGEIVKPATCTETGIIRYHCTDSTCNSTFEDVIAATGHKFDIGEVTKEPDCVSAGVFTRTCENPGCGYKENSVYLAPLGHDYDDGVITKYPTVNAVGEITYTCQREGCTEDTADHSYTVDILNAPFFSGILYTNEGAYYDVVNGGMKDLTWLITDAYDLYIYADGTAEEDYSWENYRHDIVNAYVIGKTTTVTNGSFAYMASLKTVNLSTNLTTIEEYAFQQCPVLENVFIGSVESVGTYAFFDCPNLKTVEIRGGLETVGDNIFKSCEKLTTVILGNGTVNIGYGMFEDCTALETIDLPDSISSIGELAFDDCKSLKAIVIPDSVAEVGGYAFHNCIAAETLYIGHNAEDIGEYAFSDCTALKDVTIACAMCNMNEGLFMGCSSLEKIEIEESVETIGKNVFKDCSALTSIVLPVTLKEIGDSAFAGTGLTAIEIPAEVTSIAKGAFTNCASLSAINVDMYNDSYYSVNGVLYDMALATLVVCPAGKQGAYTVKDGTTTIAEDAFIGCTGITEVEIPNSVTTIANNAFNGCADTIKIKAQCDAYAIQYAKSRGIAYEITKHVAASVWVETLAPTCTTAGEKQRECSGCGEVYETAEVKELGHDYVGSITTEPKCETVGTMTYTCSRCNDSYTEDIPATGHSKLAETVIKEPSCTEKGTLRKECTHQGCTYHIDSDIDALGHDYIETVVTPATCEGVGELEITCSRCNYKETKDIPATGHTWTVVSTKPATCTAEGVIRMACACGKTKTEAIPMIAHQLHHNVTQAPTCTKDGITGDKCAICNQYIGATTVIPATGHQFGANGTCNVCGASNGAQQPGTPGGSTVVTPVKPGTGTTTPAQQLATPKMLLIKNTIKGVTVTWNAVEGATSYRVYRRGAGQSWKYITTVKTTSFTDANAQSGKLWRYTVRAENATQRSAYESGLLIKAVATPHLTKIQNTVDGVKISWTKVDNAEGYRVYRRGAGQSWKYLKTVKTTSFVDTTAKTGTLYRYTVRAIDGHFSAFESGLLTRFVATPHITGAQNVSTGVKVTWNGVEGADSYRVYRRGAGESWKYIGTVKTTNYVDTAVNNDNGTLYRYTVRAVDSGRYSAYESGKVIRVK